MKQNNTNKTFKTELEKLKQMSIEDRIWYIWEYYKLQIFAFFLVIFLLYEATLIFLLFKRNLKKKMALTKLGSKTLFLTVLYLLMTATKKFMTSIITPHQTLS